MSTEEVIEYMAYDIANTEDFEKEMKRSKELELSRKLSPKEFTAKFKALLGGRK